MKILLVEDEKPLALALKSLLEKNKYNIDTTYDGIDGLDYALSNSYDLIILDVMLPKMNGFDVLKQIRKQKINTPVLMLTAKSEVADKVAGLDFGADDYMSKPFDTDELLARIRALLRRKGEISEDILTFENLSLDVKSMELLCDTKSVKLSQKEFSLMQMLMINKSNIVTKEQLVEKIWGYNAETEYNSVEVYISFLRKKLSFLNTNAEIKTLRGLGYSMGSRVW